MDHNHSIAAAIATFVTLGVAFGVIFAEQKKKERKPQRLTPLPREKLPRSFEALPSAGERFPRD